MPLALTGGQKLGIALVAAAFIAFAVVSAFVIPRRDPNYPGPRLPLFVAVSVALFVAMMTAMFALAREEEAERHGEPAPAETQPAPGQETDGETQTEGEAVEGDPEAGRQVFEAAGCGGCHVLEAAGSAGTVGPNLDQAQPGFEETVEQVRDGGGGMPAFGDRLSEEEIRNVSAFVVESAGG